MHVAVIHDPGICDNTRFSVMNKCMRAVSLDLIKHQKERTSLHKASIVLQVWNPEPNIPKDMGHVHLYMIFSFGGQHKFVLFSEFVLDVVNGHV
jgi:hypothetical protein